MDHFQRDSVMVEQFLNGILLMQKQLDIKIGKKIGKTIWKAINAGFELYEGMFEAAPLETALLSLVGVTKLLKSKNIKSFTRSVSDAIDSDVPCLDKAGFHNSAHQRYHVLP